MRHDLNSPSVVREVRVTRIIASQNLKIVMCLLSKLWLWSKAHIIPVNWRLVCGIISSTTVSSVIYSVTQAADCNISP